MGRKFDLKYLGVEKQVFVMEIHVDMKNGKKGLSKVKYVKNILHIFGMNQVKPVNTPLDSHFKLD